MPNLAERIRVGDSQAFKQCYDDHFVAVWQFAYRIVRSRDTASDVAQNSFITLWNNRSKLSIDINLRAYLFGIARNLAVNVVRHDVIVEKAANQALSIGEMLGTGSNLSSPDADLTEFELNAAAARAIDALPERQRTAVLLRWREGLSNAEIARVLEVGEPAVSQLLARATATLRTALCEFLEGSND